MVQFLEQDGKLVCHMEGQLSTMTCQELQSELFPKVTEAHLPVVFDLKKVDFVSSAFLRICISANKLVGADKFSIINIHPSVKKVFRIAGLQEFIRYE